MITFSMSIVVRKSPDTEQFRPKMRRRSIDLSGQEQLESFGGKLGVVYHLTLFKSNLSILLERP